MTKVNTYVSPYIFFSAFHMNVYINPIIWLAYFSILVAWAEWPKLVIFKFHQSMPCGYSKLVPEVAWPDGKWIRAIQPLNPEKTSKDVLKTPKMVIYYHLFDIFSGPSDLIDLIPFALCQATSGTSLEYPHGILWWNLKIVIFGHPGPQGGDSLELNPIYSQNVFLKDDF